MEKFFKGKLVLVTGGAGFIGTNLVRRLLKEGAKVRVLDNFFTGLKENLKDLDIEIVEGNVENLEDVYNSLKDIEIVFHLAARNIIASTKEPYKDFLTNVLGTINILKACLEKNFKVKKIVYASSVSIYGNAKYLPINEEDSKIILNPYAASKLSAEAYCSAFFETYGIPINVVRYSNVYGPYQNPLNPYCGVVSKFITWALSGEPILIYGDGEQTRDFTYVEDVVEATLKAATIMPGLTFNIGSGIETSINKLAQLIIELTESKSQILHIEKRDIDDVRRRVLNIEFARRVLRWSPKIDLYQGLKNTIDWVKSQLALNK
ncbi:MAG: NAD-dependent epimerase/dehydratase family protein [Dictyoglomus sp.]|nr:NAD-dependent epimerase/dehydratase family protein [Dictyoglomus sp.]MCX7845813.1 NAD-dependent epimerase/dehydratase family protein [Dictyoglomaceae bacterium]MDW8187994.1 NAD-dependent epimerase/dehydratase family protein [Dictyoglomus sp.]